MVNMKSTIMVIVPEEEWVHIRDTQTQILEVLKDIGTKREANILKAKHITAMEFMAAVRIKRTKFDQLVTTNKLRIIKKGRKIYVPVSEVDRFFLDSSIR